MFSKLKNFFLPILSWFLLSCPAGLAAVYDSAWITSSRRQSVISYQLSSASIHANGNRILRQLAAARDVSPGSIHLLVNFQEVLRVELRPNQNPVVLMQVLGVIADSREQYRGFPVGDVLVPDRLTCNLNLVSLPDSVNLRQYRLNDLDMAQLAIGYTSSEIPVVEPGKLSVTLSDFTFTYSDNALRSFGEKLRLINDYYAASAWMDTLLSRNQNCRPGTTEGLPGNYLCAMETSKIVRILEEKNLPFHLDLAHYDPRNYLKSHSELFRLSRSMCMNFEQDLQRFVHGTWKGSLDLLADRYVAHLVRYIDHSLILGDARGSIYEEYLSRYFDIPVFGNDRQIFLDLAHALVDDRSPDSAPALICRNLWEHYMDQASALTGRKKFAEALRLLKHATSFVEHAPDFIPTSGVLDSLTAVAVSGVYGSYLWIAGNCVALRKFSMAEDYLEKAEEYKQAYPDVAPSDTLLSRIYMSLYEQQLLSCDRLLAADRFREALDCYQDFEQTFPAKRITYLKRDLDARRMEIFRGMFDDAALLAFARMRAGDRDSALAWYDRACEWQALIPDDRDAALTLEDLRTIMLPARYQALAERVEYLSLASRYEEAWQAFSQLKSIGDATGRQMNTMLDSLYALAYKHHMLNEISMATGMIWNNRLEEAQSYAREIESVMDVYNLKLDPDLQLALAGYQRKIERKICQNIQDEVRSLTIRAHRNLELLQFDLAVTRLAEARRTAQENRGCEIPASALTDTINRYLAAAFFQEKLKQVQQMIAIGQYGDAVQIAFDNENFYRNTNLQSLKVPFTSADDLIRDASLSPFTAAAVDFGIRTGNPELSWKYLTWLKLQDASPREVRAQQEMVGSALARRDFGLNPAGSMIENVKRYTGGNHWFVIFEAQYLSVWKQLFNETYIYKR